MIDSLAENIGENDITIPSIASQDIIAQNITSQEMTVTYYYCDFSDMESLEMSNILGSIIRQLLEKIIIPHNVGEQIDSFYKLGSRTPADNELVAILTSTLEHFSKVFIFIDGLDECKREVQLTILSIVRQLSLSQLPLLKILITSREEVVISTSLSGLPRLRISAENISDDIVSFIEETVKSNIETRALVIQDAALEAEIILALQKGAQGM